MEHLQRVGVSESGPLLQVGLRLAAQSLPESGDIPFLQQAITFFRSASGFGFWVNPRLGTDQRDNLGVFAFQRVDVDLRSTARLNRQACQEARQKPSSLLFRGHGANVEGRLTGVKTCVRKWVVCTDFAEIRFGLDLPIDCGRGREAVV